MKSTLKLGVTLPALLIVLACPAVASAQNSGGDVPADTGGDISGAVLTAEPAKEQAPSDQPAPGEIVVTGAKRTSLLNRVGLTMTAFGADTIERQNISSVQDLVKVVPGLAYTESTSSTPIYTLRGVGFYEVSLSAYPAVTVYVDQVPLQFPALTRNAGLDLERIEVLKGPQGIAFGQNSTGGAINYIAAKPTEDFQAGASLSYERFNHVEGTAFISGPLSDTLTARAAFKTVHADDWQYSYTNGQKSGKQEEYIGRLLVNWEPADNLEFLLNVNGWINKSDPQAGQFSSLNPQISSAVAVIDILEAIPFAPSNNRAANWAFPLKNDDSQYQISLTGKYGIADDIELTSISSYAHYKKDSVDTNSGLEIPNEDVPLHIGFVKTFTQELRLANGNDNDFRWSFGGNYEKSHVYELQEFDYSISTLSTAFGVNGNKFFSDQHMENFAVFGSGEFDITPDFTLKGGLRYTNSKRSFSGCGFDSGDGLFGALFSSISSALSGTNVTIAPGGCAVLDQVTFLPQLFEDDLNQDNLSWQVGVDYRVTPTLLLYGSVAKGYKGGGFPTVGAATNKQYEPVVQEAVLDIEGGVKAQLFDRRISLNAAAFYYDYSNKQVRTKLIDPIFGIIDALANVPKSHVVGVELSLAGRPADGLDVSLSGTYIEAIVDKYTGVDGTRGVLADFSDTNLPFSPKFQGAATVDYQWDMFDGNMASIGATVSHHGKTSAIVGGGDAARIAAYTLLDLRASISTADERWRFSLFGDNVTNKYYWTNVVQVYDTTVRYTGRPATYGAMISFKY